MILAKPIVGSDGKILLSSSVELKSSMASRLQNWGVMVAHIVDEEEEECSEEIEAQMEALKTRFNGVLDNNNMHSLYQAISKIIQEKE